MHDLLRGLRDRLDDGDAGCACDPAFEDDLLSVDADGCPGGGDLAGAPACRATVVAALRDRDADAIVVCRRGLDRRYDGRGAALLGAAGRFAALADPHDERVAARALRDPLAAAREAAGRTGPVARIGAETALVDVAEGVDGYDDLLRPRLGIAVAHGYVAPDPPSGARLDGTRDLDSGATVAVYSLPERPLRTYHIEPVELSLDPEARATLVAARERLAGGGAGSGDRAPARAVRSVAREADPVPALVAALRKHTRGYGVLEDLFADPAVSDVYASAPVADSDLRAIVDGETMRTNVRLSADGAAALASRLRRASGRAFSRAEPTIDAAAGAIGAADAVRAAGVTDPASDGTGFAFRAHGRTAWTLPALVENDTLSARAGALLSLAVERAASVLVAGTRGAGKTTLLGALCWELPAATRLLVVEDTPELPVAALRERGRDVQTLRTDPEEGSGLAPAAALRTALRLGESALVVGEVRGEEAGVLYEAMRVGAGGSAVLGTIHGDGASAVRERVVSALGVPPSSFAATDLVVTLRPRETPDGTVRRVVAVEEVIDADDGPVDAALFERDDALAATGLADRGESRLLASLARDGASYGDVLDLLDDRAAFLDALAGAGRTDPAAVVEAHAERRSDAAADR